MKVSLGSWMRFWEGIYMNKALATTIRTSAQIAQNKPWKYLNVYRFWQLNLSCFLLSVQVPFLMYLILKYVKIKVNELSFELNYWSRLLRKKEKKISRDCDTNTITLSYSNNCTQLRSYIHQ